MYLRSIRGLEGEVTIPSIGASVGTTLKWSLERREDRTSGVGVYVFRAVFSYLNVYLFQEESHKKEIRVRVGSGGKWHRIEPVEGSSIKLEDNTAITIDEVTVWPVED